jgi:hypothetical protein
MFLACLSAAGALRRLNCFRRERERGETEERQRQGERQRKREADTTTREASDR